MTKLDYDEASTENTKHKLGVNLKCELQLFFASFLNFIVEGINEDTAKEKLYDKVKSACDKEHTNYLHCNTEDLRWTLLGVHYVLYEPLCSLHNLFSERRELLFSNTNKNLILSICHCLSLKNEEYLTYFSRINSYEYYDVERNILKTFLKIQIKGELDMLDSIDMRILSPH